MQLDYRRRCKYSMLSNTNSELSNFHEDDSLPRGSYKLLRDTNQVN